MKRKLTPTLIPMFIRLTLIVALGLMRVAAAPSIDYISPTPGSTQSELLSVEVVFESPVTGVDAEDLIVGGGFASAVFEPTQGHFVFTFPAAATGTVVLSWAENHGITDLGGIPFRGSPWSYPVDATIANGRVLISEFMAGNTRTLNDEDGDSSDWIEVHNPGESAVSLVGWILTDEPGVMKWKFPEITLESRQYLIVFASGKDRRSPSGRLHTNFKLAPEGEYLGLLNADARVVSEFTPLYPAQQPNVSYGRVTGSREILGFFSTPTPGKANASGGPGFASEVQFSRRSGTFSEPFNLVLSSANARAVIRYTMDGSMPTNSSPVYDGTIRITDTTQVRARAYEAGLLPGPPRSENFVLLNPSIKGFTSDLPIIVMHTMTRGAVSESRNTYVHFSVYEPINGISCLTNQPVFESRGGAKVRGSSTAGLPKTSFAAEWWDEYNQDEEKAILGMPAESEWVLYAPNEYDLPMIHNPFMHQLSRDTGRYSPRTRFVEVYYNRVGGALSTNHYNGIYVLEEKISVGKNRVNIDRLEREHNSVPVVTGGYLLKIDRLDPGDSGFNGAGVTMAHIDPKEKEIKLPQRSAQKKYLTDYFSSFVKALNSTNWMDPILGYEPYIDAQAWVDYHVLETVSGNVDSLVLSCYLHKPREGRITFGPHWDFDRALGSTDGRDSNPRQWQTGPFFTASWWNRLFRDPKFWQRWVDRYQEYRTNHLTQTNINRLIDGFADELRQAQPRDRKRWNRATRGGTYQSEVNLMKTWLSNRLDYIDKQFARPPSLSLSEGRVSKGAILELSLPSTPTNSMIYYTLDGSDPRLPQGGVATNAILYGGPISITQTVRIKARAWNGTVKQTGGPPVTTPWSMPIAATYAVDLPHLVLTEVMPGRMQASRESPGDALAFMEFTNFGTNAIDLTGFTIDGDVSYAFGSTGMSKSLEPGARVVVALNPVQFGVSYPAATNVVGGFKGTLDRKHPSIIVKGARGETILSAQPQVADTTLAEGLGFSIVAREEAGAGGGTWRLSARDGGSPGEVDPAPLEVPRVWINEVLSNPRSGERDWVELHNPNAAEVDVSGWFLSDRRDSPRQLRLGKGTRIPAGGFVVIEPNKSPTVHSGVFALEASGEEIHLYSADEAGRFTGWHHGMDFGASERGVSQGRHVTSDGKELMVRQSSPTPGQSNAGPRIEGVIISEVHHSPLRTEDSPLGEGKYLELRNLTEESIALYDPLRPGLTWRVRGGIEYNLPGGLRLPPHGFLLIRGPQTPTKPDAIRTQAYRLKMGGPVIVTGAWKGRLGDGSESIRLLRPDETATQVIDEDVPYVKVDEVTYTNREPWPTVTEGTVAALTRRHPARFGNDPNAWTYQPPTPGDVDSDGDGLTDRWEMANDLNPSQAGGVDGKTGDPDNDGLTNASEFERGLAPNHQETETAPRIRVEFTVDKTIWIQFSRASGIAYTLQATEALETGIWDNLLELAPKAFTEPFGVELSPVGGSRYYRVRTR